MMASHQILCFNAFSMTSLQVLPKAGHAAATRIFLSDGIETLCSRIQNNRHQRLNPQVLCCKAGQSSPLSVINLQGMKGLVIRSSRLVDGKPARFRRQYSHLPQAEMQEMRI
jgi:hypothetical protein